MEDRDRHGSAQMTCTVCNGDREAGAPTRQREPEPIDEDEEPGSWQLAVKSAVLADGLGEMDDNGAEYEAEAAERFEDPEIRAAWVTLRRAGVDLPSIVDQEHDGRPIASNHHEAGLAGEAGPAVLVTPDRTTCNQCGAAFAGDWPPRCCVAWDGEDA